jgi:hypothetical protein
MKKPTSTQLCVTCDKQIAGFFKTCPFCKHKIAKPLAEKTPTAIGGGAINPWTGAPDKPESKTQKKERDRHKPQKPSKAESSRITECSDCKEQISVAALACPHCGAPRPKTDVEGVITGFLVLIVLVFLLYQCGSDDEPSKPSEPVELTDGQIEKRNEGAALFNVYGQINSKLRDPDSFKLIARDVLTQPDGSISVAMEYRAKNGFGGYTVNHAAYTCQPSSSGVSCTEVR